MSKEDFEAIIGKVVVDVEFRNTLLADPDQALAGCELTEQEVYILKHIDGETIEAMSHILDARISKIRCAEETVKPSSH